MRVFKALRRSIKGTERDSKPPISIAPKSAVAIVPPKKVIRALYDYDARTSQELSFSRGDFFHVIGRENDSDWYEACNPALPDARGLVPVSYFKALGRTERDSANSDTSRTSPTITKNPDHDSGYAETSASSVTPTPAVSQRNSKMSTKSGAMVYGIVMYDFQAERADELEAKAGEAIIVIAQSNPEWFVAKPIGRLGGPGLIPVSFIEIRDMASNTPVPNPQDAIKRAGIPRVEEWKKMAADYKNSSITLGKLDGGPDGKNPQQALEQGMERMSLQQGGGRTSQQLQNSRNTQSQQPQAVPQVPSPGSQLYAPISARIPRYCFAEDKYWFVIEAALEDGRHWELSRYYEDFYDFQIALLTEFPAEAGNTGTQKRSLPYMPGPVNYVTDAITEGRLHNLDAYVKNLLEQPPYISRCNLVKQFFAPREGDYEIDAPTEGDEYRLSGASHRSSQGQGTPPTGLSQQSSIDRINGNGYGSPAAPGHRGANGMPRQTSSVSQSSPGPALNQTAAMKVKLSYNGDLIAIRVPTDIQYRELYEKIRDRLKVPAGETIDISYKDERSQDKLPMVSNNDLDTALERNEKLLLYVEHV
ncbi:bud emergence protein 1 [Cytospora paraplurivora]|uniref:Bud emergence protein 1 n=1 Tax=Cytospora paraplurivora TaxID=2898453 RepID=A0AAN9UJ37_9PEZI